MERFRNMSEERYCCIFRGQEVGVSKWFRVNFSKGEVLTPEKLKHFPHIIALRTVKCIHQTIKQVIERKRQQKTMCSVKLKRKKKREKYIA